MQQPSLQYTFTFEELSAPSELPRLHRYQGDPSTWPDKTSSEDTQTICHDRTNIDGSPHRFVVSVGDKVRYQLQDQAQGRGQVVLVSHSKQLACVALSGKSVEVWFELAELFPANREDELVQF